MWLALLEREHDNLRAVLTWALEEQPPDASAAPGRAEPLELGMRLASAIWRFWHVRGHVTEGRAWLSRLLAPAPAHMERERAQALRARMLAAQAALATEQGDHAQAAIFAGESLDLYRALGDRRRIAVVLNILGTTAMRLGDYGRAETLYAESLALFRDLAVPQSIAVVLNNLGTVARCQGQHDRAAALFEESMAMKQELGDARGIAASLNNLGEIALDQGELARAADLFEQSLASFREQDGQWGIALLLTNLGDVARARREFPRAAGLYRQSLLLYREQRNYVDVCESLEGFADVVRALGDGQRAAWLLAATSTLRATLNMPVSPAERAGHEQIIGAARGALGEEAFSAAWAVGAAMAPDAAIAVALDWEARAGPPRR
jgi:tetratricopeptide (TPR) repeat protein